MLLKMNLTNNINSSEKVYKDLLESYFTAIYPNEKLISHGLDHHRRVWTYAKELLQYVEDKKNTSDRLFIQKLLIACYLHDIGIVVDPGIKHGSSSRELCERFLEQNHMLKSDYRDVLQAIEHHDDKEYNAPQNGSLLLRILTVADDLDAFGYTGIYRYAEIYLLRDVPLSAMGNLILANASTRYSNFTSSYAPFPDLIRNHQKRFNILSEFFHQYNRRSARYSFAGIKPSGYCGVIEIIKKNLEGDKEPRLNIIDTNVFYNDPVINDFFFKLQNELSSKNQIPC
jgi:hypothetical protein